LEGWAKKNAQTHYSIIPAFHFVCSAVDFFFLLGGRRDLYNFLSDKNPREERRIPHSPFRIPNFNGFHLDFYFF